LCRPKHVEQLRNSGIINNTSRLHLVGSFYEFYIAMHGFMNIKYKIFLQHVNNTAHAFERLAVKLTLKTLN